MACEIRDVSACGGVRYTAKVKEDVQVCLPATVDTYYPIQVLTVSPTAARAILPSEGGDSLWIINGFRCR